MANRKVTRTETRRGKRRPQGRDGLRARLLGFHRIAQQAVNRRGSRRLHMTRHAAIAETPAEINEFDDDLLTPGLLKRLLHWALGILLIPLCFVTVITLIQESGEDRILQTIWYSTELVCFLAGALLMISWFVAGVANDQLLYLYVLGHEMTHAMFVYLCGGRISTIHFSTRGGFVMTNKSNILIALSPYFVPFWSAVLISLHSFVSLWTTIPAGGLILTGLLGFTWTFHIMWTVWMIPKDQPDLKENGKFFSFMLIVFANLILFSVMLCATSREVQLASFLFRWWNHSLDLMEHLWRLLPFAL